MSPGTGDLKPDSPAGTLNVFELVDGAAAVATIFGQEYAAGVLEAFSKIGAPIAGYFGYGDDPASSESFTNGSDNWTVALSLNNTPNQSGSYPVHINDSTLLSNPQGWTFCNMYENRMQYFDQPFYQADGYTTNGYSGGNHVMSFDNYGREADEPFFVRTR